VVFPPDYPYSSGNSRALHDNFEDLARQASGWLGGLCADDLVVDIGANDGTLLSKFDCRTVGVEPTGQAAGSPADAYREFFSEALAREIVAEHGKAQVVTACNVLAHVDDIADVMRGIGVLLADDGILIAENHDLASVVDGQWDTVYHEHLRFYDPHSFNALLQAYGFGCREWQRIPTHGGSFRMLAQRGVHVDPSPRDYDFAGSRPGRSGHAGNSGACRGRGASARPHGRPRSSTTAASTWRTSLRLRGPGLRQDRALHPRDPHPGRGRGAAVRGAAAGRGPVLLASRGRDRPEAP
jgi:hypothetical protein